MLNTIKINMLLIGIILILFGVGMIIISMSVFIYTSKLLKEYDTEGLAKIKRYVKQIGHESLIPIYDLIYEDTLYELRSNMGAVEQKYKVGEEVRVWFKSENPFKFISDVELDIWHRLSLTFKTLGLFSILPGGFSAIISILLGIFIR